LCPPCGPGDEEVGVLIGANLSTSGVRAGWSDPNRAMLDPSRDGTVRSAADAMTTRRVTRQLKLSHLDEDGRVRMVDVSLKPPTARQAIARGFVRMAPATIRLIRAGRIAKGDPLQAARLAGIMAAKKTAEIIPLCHPLSLTHCDVQFRARRAGYEIEAVARTTGPTGVEMEALTAVAAAGLTVYDMVKAVDRAVVIGEIRLIEKQGGRSGHWVRGT
jgi:cyclic pyranopterin monophosphate synthase